MIHFPKPGPIPGRFLIPSRIMNSRIIKKSLFMILLKMILLTS